jgi:hypothetical protein
MCTELFQFHISPVASTPSNQTSDSDTPLRMLQTQWLQEGSTHKNVSSKGSVPLMPQKPEGSFYCSFSPCYSLEGFQVERMGQTQQC